MALFNDRRGFESYIRVNSYSTERLGHIVGRALVALFRNQTAVEQSQNNAVNTNNVGFNKPDSKSGSITAKYYLKHKKLEDWMVRKWLDVNELGHMRISKYWKQINEAAAQKASS